MNQKYELEELKQAYAQLRKKESLPMSLVVALLAVVLVVLVYHMFSAMGGILLIVLLFPPMLIGFFAAVLGRPFRMSIRVMVGIIAFLVHLYGAHFVLQIHPLFLLISPLAFFIAVIFCKIQLNPLQRNALDYAELGKLDEE